MPKVKSSLYPVNPGVVTQLLAFGYKVYKLPESEVISLQEKSFLESGSSCHYLVFKSSLAQDSLSNSEPLAKVNKLAEEDLSSGILKAIKTAYMSGYDNTPETHNGLIDLVLETQRLRIVYQPSMTLLSILSLGA